MNFEKIDNLYQDIADAVVDSIPDSWDKVLLYADISEDMSIVFFYFFPHGSINPIYCGDIPDKYSIDDMAYKLKLYRLTKIFQKLRQAFLDYGQRVWTNLTFVIDNTGKFNVDYNYDDISEINPYEQFERWKSKNLDAAE